MRVHKNAILRPAVSIQFYGIIRWGNIGIFHAKNLFEFFSQSQSMLEGFYMMRDPEEPISKRFLFGITMAGSCTL